MTFEQYKDSLLPGNYAITKSMEISKTTTSGTLWYTKKFLVLYYYVFLSDDIDTDVYIEKVTESFDSYIASMQEALRAEAEQYFYPEDHDGINFKSEKFVKYSSFAGCTGFRNEKEKMKYHLNAKKCYFMLLMNVGGQTGVKKIFKEKLAEEGFVYSKESIQELLYNAAISVCAEQLASEGEIRDNSVKNILMASALRLIENLEDEDICFSNIKEIADACGGLHEKYKSIENDAVAFIRNERQILFYYGYFHSKSSGANDIEFSSLTPVGEVALTADYMEFLVVWEHQKVKMISQSALVEINDVPADADASKFAISFTPYVDVLDFMHRYGGITLDEYKYYVSRKKRPYQEQYDEIEEEIVERIDEVKSHVTGFQRKRDVKDEDGQKELAKYLQGCRTDIAMDGGHNPLAFCRKVAGGYHVEDEAALGTMLHIYKVLNQYKIQKAQDVFVDAERELTRRYRESQQHPDSPLNAKVKIRWDFYNIGVDKFILLGVMIAIACVKARIDFKHLSDRKQSAVISDYVMRHFPGLLKELGTRTEKQRKAMIQEAMVALQKRDYSLYLTGDTEQEVTTFQYMSEASADLWKKIETQSQRADVTKSNARKRNTTLISVLKAYYMKRYMKDGILPCEACEGESFLTHKGEPYIEFHHLIPFKEAYGPDHYLNLYAICPICHRKLHYMATGDKRAIYQGLDLHNHLGLTIVERLKKLKNQKLLKSYHLEYLLADEAITQAEYDDIAA